ncbi:GntR family transcriptional regulator [Cypionkella aquatica]|uniref:GntR family transcriptional regulator n=1 Tax=Cypionkella aquatica TaxID=1756042 RepID=A0AA37UB73_9RHOB|nr:GntR family transcriptional regulator [Cypionkella aquatica]GLS88241.1 GntR family transcriptional regulator [Cypionkella aquatica]
MDTAFDDLKIENPPQTLREIVHARMRGAILSGRFASGERLVERNLCEQLGVSRSVVREAIRYLEAEGLVETMPNKGPMVARMDWPQAVQIYEIRQLLEQSAAAACASVADAGVKQALHATMTAIEQAQTTAARIDATTQFYEVIFRAAGHHIAWEVVQRLNGRISRLRAMTLATTDRRVSGPVRMARICAAILANDAEAAAQAVCDHLDEAAKIAERLLKETP